MTATTEGSLDSTLVPVTKRTYRHHRRSFAINRRKWKTQNNYDGAPIPHSNYDAARRFRTTTGLHYPNPHGETENPMHKDPAM